MTAHDQSKHDQRDEDAGFMEEAIRLSHLHRGQTSTNPSVGCVIVRDDGNGPVIVGSAVTAIGGRPHAETQALTNAGDKAKGATAYVTLEPCSHHGKTPPCTDALIASGIGRVVISVLDPDERVSGTGVALLREAGIAVTLGILSREAERAQEAYLMRKRSKRPHVTLKLAVSADGMIGRQGEGQVRITGPEAREAVHHLRARTDAILVGIGTAIADDPKLTCRLEGLENHSPIRIVLDRRLDLPLSSKLAMTARDVPVIAVADLAAASVEGLDPRREALEAAGVEILDCDPTRLDDLLTALASRGVSSLVVEGGAKTARSFFDAGLVDRILLFRGPGTLGADGIASPFDPQSIPAGFVLVETRSFGADICENYERDI
jgi:diaminohydroxyphosphoribosylaminopyrimidine deaminase/5-amino-6-(5-phosphoribosylamino)uracil reductase